MHNLLLNRQDSPSAVGSFSGASTLESASPTGSVIFASITSVGTAPISAPALASSIPIITTSPAQSSETSTPTAASASSRSQIALGTVIAVCIAVFVGACLLLYSFWWWYSRSNLKARSRAKNGSNADLRNDHGEVDKRKIRGRSWNRLGDEEDPPKVGMPSPAKNQSQAEIDEKNFPMFKKSNSMRTVRTTKAIEEHGIDLPPLEFSAYHPKLAEELSLNEPQKPFSRQESGVSWDGDTVRDDFLSLRSVRAESGTMSPSIELAKITPPATTSVVHTWHSAEVVTMGQVPEIDEGPRTVTNPFFNAQELSRSTSRPRSRSNSQTGRRSRATSISSRASRPQSQAPSHIINPFADAEEIAVPTFRAHIQSDSIESNPFASEHAMKSLIAALELTQEEVEERLRAASMRRSMISRYSGISQITGITDEEDLAAIRTFPIPPTP